QRLEKVLKVLHGKQAEYIFRKNSLLIEAIKILAEKTLDADAQYAPFEILGLEQELVSDYEPENSVPVPGGLEKLRLGGKVDRLDRKDGQIRIVDYKTGYLKKDSFDFQENEELSIENKEAFQT